MRRIDNQSFWRFFRCYVGCFAVAIEPLARSFGHPVAQHVAQLGVVGFALLTQFLELLGIVHQFFHRLDGGRVGGLLWHFGLAADGQSPHQQERADVLHDVIPPTDQTCGPALTWEAPGIRWFGRAQ